MKITEEQLETLCFWFHKHWRMGDYTEEQKAMWKAINNLPEEEYIDAMIESLEEIGIKVIKK